MSDIARHQKKTSVKDFTTLGAGKTLDSIWQMAELGDVWFGGGNSFQYEHGIDGRDRAREERRSETACMEAVGGAGSSIEELLCAALAGGLIERDRD
jgi:hypothetical protein